MAKVLLVEDDASQCISYSRDMRAEGHIVDIETTVAEALSAIQQKVYDAVFADHGLPDGSGLAVVRVAVEKGIRTVVLMSASPLVEIIGTGGTLPEGVEFISKTKFEQLEARMINPVPLGQPSSC